MFKRGMKVVKIIRGPTVNTAAIHTVETVRKGVVRLVDSTLDYRDATGQEIDPGIPGFTSEIVALED